MIDPKVAQEIIAELNKLVIHGASSPEYKNGNNNAIKKAIIVIENKTKKK